MANGTELRLNFVGGHAETAFDVFDVRAPGGHRLIIKQGENYSVVDFPRLNEKEAADLLGVSVRTMQNWRQNGKGPRFFKIGRAVRYSVSDLVDFIAARARTSTSDSGPAASRR